MRRGRTAVVAEAKCPETAHETETSVDGGESSLSEAPGAAAAAAVAGRDERPRHRRRDSRCVDVTRHHRRHSR